MTKSITENKETYEKKMEDVPLGRASEPDEQAGMAVFLLSDYASCECWCKKGMGEEVLRLIDWLVGWVDG